MSHVIIGIDNGVSGAVAAISAFDGSLIEAVEMPIQKARRGNEIDVLILKIILFRMSGENWQNVKKVVLEEPHGSQSADAARSMAGSFHATRATLDLCTLRWEPIRARDWQEVMLPNCKSGDTKPRALELARRLWPEETWLASPRCKVPNHNLVDAALLAEYGRTNL